MEKLKLEHVAPYLPYGLKIQYLENEIVELVGFNRNTIYHTTGFFVELPCNLKPILRPLSDLTKMFNGDSCYISYMWYSIISTDSDCFDKDEFFETCELGMINNLPYIVIPFLLEHHFDVFGLIDKGLAIDINTL